jgi:hypothetical protein
LNSLPTSSTVAQLSCLHHPATTAESCDIGRLPTDTPPDDHALPVPHRQTSFAQYPATTATSGRCDAGPLTIHVLPYDVLLGIFGYYLSWKGSAWPALVHVCQRWRNFVLGSVRHLKLQLYCIGGKPVRKMLDIWPPLPIILHHINPPSWDVDNIVAALECNDRVRDIDLTGVARPQLQTILAAMQMSFPALTHLALMSDLLSTVAPVVSNSFLGGSAPSLRSLVLGRIPFPGLPNLLLSSTNLVDLALYHVPNSGPISLEAMATCLSRLTRLNSLSLDFQSTQLFPDRERRRPPRFVLPALTRFSFRGVRGYLEDLVSRIDAPLLEDLDVVFHYEPMLETPQFAQFLSRIPKLETCKEVHVAFLSEMVIVQLCCPFSMVPRFFLMTACMFHEQLSYLAEVCRTSLSPFLLLEHLCITDQSGVSRQQDPGDIEADQWLGILGPFAAAKHLYLSKEIMPRIAPALRLVGESLTPPVLPSLRCLLLEKPYPSGPVEDAIRKFITARELSDRPIVIRDWDGLYWSSRGDVDD